jgi:hypothetical protein
MNEIRKEEHLEDSKNNKQLYNNYRPERFAYGHASESVCVEMVGIINKTIYTAILKFHRFFVFATNLNLFFHMGNSLFVFFSYLNKIL